MGFQVVDGAMVEIIEESQPTVCFSLTSMRSGPERNARGQVTLGLLEAMRRCIGPDLCSRNQGRILSV